MRTDTDIQTHTHIHTSASEPTISGAMNTIEKAIPSLCDYFPRNFIGKAVFICLVGSVNLVLKFQGMFFSAGWTPQNYST